MTTSSHVARFYNSYRKEEYMPVVDYHCTACGACCAAFCIKPPHGRATVSTPLTERDIQRLPERIRRQLVQVEVGSGMSRRTTFLLPAVESEGVLACKFFRGKVGSHCRCGIYKYRPFNCRWFASDPENRQCRLSRSVYGIEEVTRWLDPWEAERCLPEQQKVLAPYIRKARGGEKIPGAKKGVFTDDMSEVCEGADKVGLVTASRRLLER